MVELSFLFISIVDVLSEEKYIKCGCLLYGKLALHWSFVMYFQTIYFDVYTT